MRGLIASVSKKDYLRYIAYTAEKSLGKMRLHRQNTGRIVTQIVMIVDMEHLSLRQFTDKLGMTQYIMLPNEEITDGFVKYGYSHGNRH